VRSRGPRIDCVPEALAIRFGAGPSTPNGTALPLMLMDAVEFRLAANASGTTGRLGRPFRRTGPSQLPLGARTHVLDDDFLKGDQTGAARITRGRIDESARPHTKQFTRQLLARRIGKVDVGFEVIGSGIDFADVMETADERSLKPVVKLFVAEAPVGVLDKPKFSSLVERNFRDGSLLIKSSVPSTVMIVVESVSAFFAIRKCCLDAAAAPILDFRIDPSLG